jgi:hypothetical protein
MEYTLTAAMAVMAGSNLGAVGVAAARWYHSHACTPSNPCNACRGSGDPHFGDPLPHDREVPILMSHEGPLARDDSPATSVERPALYLVR